MKLRFSTRSFIRYLIGKIKKDFPMLIRWFCPGKLFGIRNLTIFLTTQRLFPAIFFFKSGFEIRISCKRINEWLKQDLWLLRQSDSSLLANVLLVTKGGGNYLFSKQFFTFKYLTVKFVGNLCKWHSDPKLTISFRNYWGKLRSVLLAKEPSMPLLNNFHHQIYQYFPRTVLSLLYNLL